MIAGRRASSARGSTRRGPVWCSKAKCALPLDRVHDHHCFLGPVVCRQPGAGRAAQQMVRAPPSPAPDQALGSTITRANCTRAWMNGSGMMVWENVFGSWIGWSAARPFDPARDAADPAPLRRGLCRRGLDAARADARAGVYASLWEAEGVAFMDLVPRQNRRTVGCSNRARLRRKGLDWSPARHFAVGDGSRTDRDRRRCRRAAGRRSAPATGRTDQTGRTSWPSSTAARTARADFDTATPVRETRLDPGYSNGARAADSRGHGRDTRGHRSNWPSRFAESRVRLL